MNERAVSLLPEEKNRIKGEITAFLGSREELAFAYPYGSFLEDFPFDDIDLGVFVSGIFRDDSIWYSLRLGAEIGGLVRFPVDVRVLNFAPVTFSYHLIRGELLFKKTPIFAPLSWNRWHADTWI